MVTLRALFPADIPAHVALLAALEQVERSGEFYSAVDLAEEYANPDIELGHDVLGAFDAGELVGYASVVPRGVDATHLALHLEGAVRPSHRGRGIGTALLTTVVARADAVHAAREPARPAAYGGYGTADDTAQAQLFADAGFVPDRWTFAMRTDLTGGPPVAPAPALPAGLTPLTYTDAFAAVLRDTHNEVFLDHPGFVPWSEAAWTQGVTGSQNFRAALSLVVVADDDPARVVAYVQTDEFDAHRQATGRREAHVSRVGTRREWRGRGVAGALLGRALQGYRDAGFDEASLHVDAANPTGALGVYERAGFEVVRRVAGYRLERPALTPEVASPR